MTPEEKEKIDYQIKARKEARDQELGEWTVAIWKVFLTFIVLAFLYAILF